MEITNKVRALVLLIIFSLFSGSLWSQVPVETSGEKVIISGIAYYIHHVKKGQTAYSISKAYGVSVGDLTKENPPAVYGIREGQSLRIPAKTAADVKPVVLTSGKIINRDLNKFVYHSLKPGETVYSLSRAYGVSENEIILSNPRIEINKLSVGAEIAIPRREFMNEKQKFIDQEKKYIYHKVEKGETLSSIARKYGLTIRVLRKENRNLRFPKVGDFVKIPSTAVQEPEPDEQVEADTLEAVIEEPVVKLEKPAGFTIVNNLKGAVNVAVLLPFHLYENSAATRPGDLKGQKKPDGWIFPPSLDFIEMYNGILLAADTLRSLGLEVNISAYDIRSDTGTITRLISSGKLSDMDLIIGPVHSYNLNIVSKYARDLGIPVVSPVDLMNNSVLMNNKTLFMANPSLEIVQKALAVKAAENNNDNIVFIHTDTTGSDPDVRRLKDLIFKELTGKMAYEDIRFRELFFYSRSIFGNDSINRLGHSLSENSSNTVIIASEEPPVVSEVITILHSLSKRFDIKVLAYPSIRYIDRLDPRLFFELDMQILSPYRIGYSKENVKQFNKDYFKKFMTMPVESSFAWSGYDICYYFLSGLAIHGDLFTEHPEIHNPELLQNEFEFEREEETDGFENHKLFNIRYTKDYDVRILE